MLSEIFLNSRNEAYLARVSIFVHLVTDHIFIYPFILYHLFYFVLFHFILFYLMSFIDDQHFFLLLFFHLFCNNLPCSGMFRNVPVLLTPFLALHIHSWQVNANILKITRNAFLRDFYFPL